MTVDTNEQSVAAEEALIHERLLALAQDAVAILREDIPLFFEREARRRFLDAPAFAGGLDQEALAALKGALAEAGARAAEAVAQALGELGPWLAGVELAGEGGGALEDNPKLWAAVQERLAPLAELLARHGFPPDPGPVPYALDYRAPRRFVAGRYMPTIAEKYWRCVAELRALEATRRRADEDAQRSALAMRWDGA